VAETLVNLHKAVLDRVESDADAIGLRMAQACRDEIPEYAGVRDPAFAAEVLAHAVEHVRAFVRCARRGRPPEGAELDFVRERGARRARELMPLEALLQAYLIGQRTVWEAVVEAAGDSPDGLRAARDLTAWTFRYTHAIDVAIATAYVAESRAQASEAARSRRDLVDLLLSGVAPGAEQARRAESLGLRPDGDHVVVVATGDARLIERALRRAEPERAFVVPRHDEVLAFLPVYVRRGPRELRAMLEQAAAVLERRHGAAPRIGLSSVCSGLAELARGYGEALRALRHAGGERAAVAIEDVALLDYLAAGADETARRLVPAGARRLRDEDARHAGALAATLRAYADCDLNVARTAQQLVVHPNTVHYRLRRVAELTGRDPRRLASLLELLTSLRLIDDHAPG
jgi:hypothetical protein